MTDQQLPQPAEEVEPEMIRGLLQRVPLGVNQTALLARGSQLVAYRGSLKQVEALDVAVHVAQDWREIGQTLRVQFMRLPLSPLSLLIAVYPLRDDYRLVLVDSEDAPFEQLRKLSVQLLSVLEVAGIGRKPV
ncbi:MAG: hypothetical protein KJ046_01425 [Anaerolineae bacterium]|nr:hypothetical protein [Anaerolineae bacterium]